MKHYEIVGCAPMNFGDVLMLESVVRHFRALLPGWQPCVRDVKVKAACSRPADIGLVEPTSIKWKTKLARLVRPSSDGAVVPESEISAIVDVCGYKYGGLWGSEALAIDLPRYRDARERGIPVVLMPKTFGPFASESTQAVCELVRSVAACYVRDAMSAHYLSAAGLRAGVDFEQFPDFTANVEGVAPRESARAFKVLLIPNINMVKAGVFANVDAYVEHLAQVARAAESVGALASLPHHLGKDRTICRQLSRLLAVPVLQVENAREAKHLIGRASLLYSDRLHGVASGLCQAVPTLTFGWSFKYAELLADWGAESSGLVAGDLEGERLREKVAAILAQRKSEQSDLSLVRKKVLQRNDLMWSKIQTILR